MISRRAALGMALVALATACGGGTLSVLHHAGKPSGDGPAHLRVKNSSGVRIERFYVARTEAVDQAKASPGSESDEALWGEDQLGNAGIGVNEVFSGLTLPAAQYDVLVVDHDRREQLVRSLELRSGGKYVLEIGTAWAMGR